MISQRVSTGVRHADVCGHSVATRSHPLARSVASDRTDDLSCVTISLGTTMASLRLATLGSSLPTIQPWSFTNLQSTFTDVPSRARALIAAQRSRYHWRCL
jgi:hypothetical protein